ncbi:sulfur carrier protein ThiS [Parashewanella curva]|uniref:Sulfur carrier protein ThiS n=1 Tax=Parashewanella curva TaxID=2338552 RepID=A0A3L8Q160_9GAMM|nr:sulfur carrier protein ThiS [Parashewanella curva]RLV61190.1 sulfur carrier protein ThiS [Parashewanella curva]
MIQINYNGDQISIDKNSTILSAIEQAILLRDESISLKGIAVVYNNKVLPRRLWTETVCQQSDELQVFQAVAGG